MAEVPVNVDRVGCVRYGMSCTAITRVDGLVGKISNRMISTQCPKSPQAHPTRN